MALKIKNKSVPEKQAPSQTPQVAIAQGIVVGCEDVIAGKAAMGSTEVVYPDGTTNSKAIKVKDVSTPDAPAYVTVSMGLTRNLGNFESVRINVGLSMPCIASPADIDDAYHEAKGWVDTRIEMLSAEIDSELGK